MSNLVKVFNDHLLEFLDDVITIFPDNTDIQTGRTFLASMKKVNPKKIIKLWKNYVNDIYLIEINKGNMDFFLSKDYTHDLRHTSEKVLNIINDIKISLRKTSKENKNKALKYVQNLCKICDLYHKT
tara:strand:+ start:4203 stop:4583 length:381 start_codon:yes stop_codon:yes gene_type:complete